jgi:hypothetical protein
MAYDNASHQLILFGGCLLTQSACVALRDTWVWSGSTWIQLSPKKSPPARDDAAMAYDPSIKKLVLFGGTGDSGGSYLNDTWEWNGATWREVSTSRSPGTRMDSMMKFDQATKQLILFGGIGSIGDYGDTWTFGHGNWTPVPSTSSPAARYSGTLAYDTSTNQFLLFGGWANGGATYYGDTWTWSGSTWVQLFPTTSPPVRARATMSFDSSTGQMILFGGWQPQAPAWTNDTWEWNGSTWKVIAPAVSPPPRADAAMAYDTSSRQLILFGGITPANENGADTWVWNN